MAGPITAASLPGSALNAPTPVAPGGSIPPLPPGPIPQLNLQAFGATPLPVQSFLNAQPSGPSTSDMAQAIIAASTPPSADPNSSSGSGNDESFMSHVMDLLNIGNYATATAAEQGIDTKNADEKSHMNFLEAAADTAWNTALGFGHGIAGAFGDSRPGDKTDWANVWMNHGPDAAILNGTQKTMPDYQQNEANKFLNDKDGGHRPIDLTRPVTADDIQKIAMTNAGAGLGMDIFADPLNVLGAGPKFAELVKNGIKGSGLFDKLVAASKPADAAADNIGNLLKDFNKSGETVGDVNRGDLIRPGESGPEVNNSTQAAVQNVAAGPKPVPEEVAPQIAPLSDADVLKASDAAGKIDPDFFNQMMRENMDTGIRQGALKPPPVAAPEEQTIGAYSTLRDEKLRGGYVNKVVSDVLNNGDGPRWATNLMSRLMNDYGDVNGLEKTGAFVERIADRFKTLRQAPLAQVMHSLRATLAADVVEHIKANKALKAPEIIQKISEGDKAAADAARPSANVSQLKDKGEKALSDAMVRDYGRQITGDGHWEKMADPAAYDAKLASGENVKWSGIKQANMLQTITNRIIKAYPGKPAIARASMSARVLRDVEQRFINMGAVPYSGHKAADSIPLRMSDVMQKLDPATVLKHPDHLTTVMRSAFSGGEMPASVIEQAPELKDAVEQAMEAAKAGSAISEAPAAQKGAQVGSQLIQQAEDSGQSDARIAEAKTLAEKAAEDITKQAGSSAATASQVRNILHTAFVDSDKFQSVATRNFAKTFNAMSKDDISFNTSNTVKYNEILHEIYGGPAINNLGRLVGPASNAIGYSGGRVAAYYGLFGHNAQRLMDFFGEKFNPAYKNPEMRPIYVQAAASARDIISHDAGIYNKLARQLDTSPETLRAGMLAAQGHIPAVADSDAAKWATQFTAHMENMLGSSAIRDTGIVGNTVAGRAQLLRSELNEAAKRYGLPGKFTNEKDVKDAMGASHDYSKGVDWVKSWQSWDIKDPLKFMMQMSNAVNYSVHKVVFFDEIASRFGKPGRTVIQNVPRLKGVYFDADRAAQIRQTLKFIKDFETPSSRVGRLLDGALSKFKTAATMYMPAHHVRALMGDLQLSWLAGNEDLSTYSAATRILKAQRGRYNDFENSAELTGEDAVRNAMARAQNQPAVAALAKGTDTILTMKNGMHVTADMIYTYMFRHGLLPNANKLLDIPEEDVMAKAMAPFNNRVHDFVHGAAELREHWVRTAHFVDQLKKAGNVDFETAGENAAREVRKWHPDGTDLTNFERRVMRRVFPFYSWTRKATPLVLESLVMRPGKVMLYPRLMHGVGLMTGAQNPQNTSTSDPFPPDGLFPNWMLEKGIGPIAGNAIDGFTSMTPNIPTMDVLETIGGLTSSDSSERASQFSSWLNPAFRIPQELMTGQTLNGSAILGRKSGYGEYLLRQIPQVSQYMSIGNVTSTDPNQPAGTLNVDKLLNVLGAMGISNDSQYNKQAAYDYANNLRTQAGTGF